MLIDEMVEKLSAGLTTGASITIDLEKWIEESIGLPPALMASLDRDDDWTFIIKVHGILEAALNHLITARLRSPEVRDIISHLETSDAKKGKIAFVKALDCLPSEARSFIRVLSELRNEAVHDIRNFDLNIIQYAASLKQGKRTNWDIGLAFGLPKDAPPEAAAVHPRGAIRAGCIVILGHALKQELVAAMIKKVEATTKINIEDIAKSAASQPQP